MKSFSAKPAEVEKKWVVIDAKGLVVGRLAVLVSMRLRGKHLPSYTPHVDDGDHVIVVNATTRPATSGPRGAMREGRVLSRNSPSKPSVAKRGPLCQAKTTSLRHRPRACVLDHALLIALLAGLGWKKSGQSRLGAP